MENVFDLLKFASSYKSVDEEVLKQFLGVLPDFIIAEWKNRGFSAYMGGLLQSTNPNDYYDIIEDWVEDPKDCHVIMRTAFGMMFYLKNGTFYAQGVNQVYTSDLRKNFQFVIEFSFCNKTYQKNVLQRDIYQKVVKKLGVPNYDEIYSFTPAISLGGNYLPENVRKVKLKEHLHLLSQL